MGPDLIRPLLAQRWPHHPEQVPRAVLTTINVNAGMGANGAQIGEQIVTAIKRYERTSGPVFASA